ncbi:MAG: SRPBCC family protein [Desulfobulbus sp.]|nr:SRPBCC family protein [Desulfobulbus sp.]
MTGTALQTTDSTIIPLPPTSIWPVLADISRYPQWWPRTLFPRVRPSTTGLIANELDLRPMGIRRFTCRVIAASEPQTIDLQYVGNFITGQAQWKLEPAGQGTRVSYVIDIVVHGTMAVLGAKIIDFRAIHSYSMRGIFQGLRNQLFE